jgi:competence protein ComK
MDNYEINNDTLALIPINASSTKIIEKNDDYIISNSVYNIMENSCEYFGSSYDGRKIGSKKILGSTYKTPIVVEETKQLIFFPTESPLNDECCWISLNNIENYSADDNLTKILFFNQRELFVHMRYQNFNNQVLRATRLLTIMKKRTNI